MSAVIDKIKKLLRMKRGGTAAEVETALALAAALARKHGIDMSAVDPDREPDEPIGHLDAVTSAKVGWENKFAALVCQEYFNVTALITQDRLSSFRGCGLRGKSEFKVRLIGTAWDRQIAIYVYHFLVGQFRRCWSTRRGRARNRHAFMHGMYMGLCSRLSEQRRQHQVNEAALMVVGRGLARREEWTPTWQAFREHPRARRACAVGRPMVSEAKGTLCNL